MKFKPGDLIECITLQHPYKDAITYLYKAKPNIKIGDVFKVAYYFSSKTVTGYWLALKDYEDVYVHEDFFKLAGPDKLFWL